MTAKRDFFDDEVKFKLDSFSDFDFEDVPSWSAFELWCAANSIDVDLNFFLVLVVASRAFQNLYSVVYDAVKEGGLVDKYANTQDFANIFYRMYSTDVLGIPGEWKKFRSWYTATHPENKYFGFGFGSVIPRDVEDMKYAMLSALDSRFPSLLLKFYASHRLALHQRDYTFVKWLDKRMPAKVAAYPQYPAFKAVRDEMRAAMADDDKIGMFLS